MKKFTNRIKQATLLIAAVLLISAPASPMLAVADGSCSAPTSDQPGVHTPNGSDAGTFTYQCDGQYSGKWTNPYYVYDPADGSRTALYNQDYQFDCAAQKWTVLWWSYSPASASFYQSRIPADAPADQATNCPVAPAATSGGSGPGSGTATTSGNGATAGSPQATIANTGTDSTNTVNNTTGINSTVINNNTVYLRNGIVSQATTGNASVIGNTIGGNALTGDASSIASIANFLQSNSSIFGPDLSNFVANINGDVNGDFMFDPSAIVNNTGSGSTNTAKNNLQINSNNTNNTTANITNDVNLGANSGAATVAGNTKGGDATTGNASAVVNLLNFINSSVAAGKSFVGTININGNLNGDILLPQNLVDQLLASTGSGSTNTATNTVTDNSTTTNNNSTNINNNITSSAQSGSANVSGNTKGGNATSGKANTNVTLLNLTGSSVVGKNDILVFVNVLGHWVGMIMNAPAGSTAASLGGGITHTGTNSTNTTNNNVGVNQTNTNNNNFGITNNVNVHATSGDATVADNTVGGNATSGNANTAVNVLNMTGTNLNLANWFGILFINVFGNWTGSFGVNTSAGDPLASNNPAATAGPSSTSATSAAPTFQFVPRATVPGASNRDYSVPTTTTTTTGSASGSSTDGVVLAAKTVAAGKEVASVSIPAQKTFNRLLLPILGVGFAFLILFAGEHKRIKS